MTWKPISTAPRDGTTIVIAEFDDPQIPSGIKVVAHWSAGEWIVNWDLSKFRMGFDATHWTPLPEPPKGKHMTSAVDAVVAALYGPPPMLKEQREAARAAIQAYHAHLEQTGWQIVPRKMTEAMFLAADDEEADTAEEMWFRALAAAPKPGIE